ncbi:alpha/beta hydrolase family protein [Actomonas aquatica]|uniref:Prolyl oligopeptidase family serine peptidase n=1 Tax=Actomonas aquatica TaxID=2866162 RepID=A0ABZ1CCN3_9BACT|nr:prolyl oligopeptidase family serine peptidase [Opitutus sp. WL0086]WRQ89191.1 prolyl oligopeptidase family serine peptidase [Opitutus sp. WL0086]
MRLLAPFLLLLLLPWSGTAADFPGETSTWNGYVRHDFVFEGHEAIVVVPDQPAPGRPWLWRARFWGHAPESDVLLLERGFHIAYCDVADLFGSPTAVERWNHFYTAMTRDYGLAPKVALKGLSRGGLIIYNWAKANPDKVSCIYGDAPVCDLRSWPGSRRDLPRWQVVLDLYGLSEDEIDTAPVSPIHGLKPLAAAGVPLLHVVGDRDETVPVADNTAVLAARYRALGGSITIIHKPDVAHHPHGLEDSTPIVDFILAHTPAPDAARP